VFPLVTIFGIVNAIEGKMLGMVNLAEEQNLNFGLRSVSCSSIKKWQGIHEIGDIIWNSQLSVCICNTVVECGPN
jgi:hypothetical protein